MSAPSSDGDRALPRKRGRSVPAVYGVVSLVLVVGAVTFALSTPPPSTPPLAAVAPAPQEQLEVERVEQSSRFGEGTGGAGDCVAGDAGCGGVGEAEPVDEQEGAPGQPPAGEPGEPDVVETRAPADLRRCVHGPGGPRQTEDPQSPPCKAEIFSGDNGGATWPGVTATEVRVAWLTGLDENGEPAAHGRRAEDAMVTHVNRRYELYGRRVVLELVDTSGFDGSPAAARALAQEVAARGVFASMSLSGAAAPVFHRELAERGVVSVTGSRQTSLPEQLLGDLHPHVWSVLPSLDEALDATGTLVCDRLSGAAARHAGDGLTTTTRRFGVLVETRSGVRVDPDRLLTRLRGCGASHQVAELDRDAPDATNARETALRRFAADGVTTVMCVCHSGGALRGSDAAESFGYQPEWLLTGHVPDEDVGKMARDQRAHTFGLTADFRALSSPSGTSSSNRRWDEQYWFHAMRDGDPGAETTSDLRPFYQELLVLAAGIQWAGPDLTPAAFGEGLAGLDFANPDVGRARWYQPAVTLGPADHGWNSDFALTWWQNSSPEEEQVSGAFRGQACYVGDGARFTADTIPADVDARFFDPEAGCR